MALTPTQLMSTPDHMIAWLKILPRDHVVTEDMMNAHACLGTRFLRAHGHNAEVIFFAGFMLDENGVDIPDSGFRVCRPVGRALMALSDIQEKKPSPITAGVALRELRKVKRKV